MQQDGDVVVEVAFGKPHREFVLVEIIGDLAIDEVAELVALRQIVDGQDLVLATLIEGLDQIGAHESGGPGDHGIHSPYSSISTVPTSVVTNGTRCDTEHSSW